MTHFRGVQPSIYKKGKKKRKKKVSIKWFPNKYSIYRHLRHLRLKPLLLLTDASG
jgi:hypothetical protein